MQALVFVIHVLSVICLITLVLLQQGKGADVGAAFGSGSSNTMFGSLGAVSFFTKLTTVVAFVFFVTSISLGVIMAKQAHRVSLVNSVLASKAPKGLPAHPLNKSVELDKKSAAGTKIPPATH